LFSTACKLEGGSALFGHMTFFYGREMIQEIEKAFSNRLLVVVVVVVVPWHLQH
jgi:hypothetical protein